MFGPIRRFLARHELEGLVGGQPALSRAHFHLDLNMRARQSRWTAERHSTSSRAVFTRRLIGRAKQPTEWMCALAADLNTIQQYLRTGLIDELHVAISPVLLGGGERLFGGD